MYGHQGEKEQEINWVIGIDIYTLLHMKQITKENLQYTTPGEGEEGKQNPPHGLVSLEKHIQLSIYVCVCACVCVCVDYEKLKTRVFEDK